jgi:hypothetical protein
MREILELQIPASSFCLVCVVDGDVGKSLCKNQGVCQREMLLWTLAIWRILVPLC